MVVSVQYITSVPVSKSYKAVVSVKVSKIDYHEVQGKNACHEMFSCDI